MNFFKSYYVPSNCVVAHHGVLDPATAMPAISKYFGRIPSAAEPEEFVSTQPPQDSERSNIAHHNRTVGYHRPSYPRSR